MCSCEASPAERGRRGGGDYWFPAPAQAHLMGAAGGGAPHLQPLFTSKLSKLPSYSRPGSHRPAIFTPSWKETSLGFKVWKGRWFGPSWEPVTPSYSDGKTLIFVPGSRSRQLISANSSENVFLHACGNWGPFRKLGSFHEQNKYLN